MANKTITDLTSGGAAQTSDLLPIDRAGSTLHVTAASVAALGGGGGGAVFSTPGQGWFYGGESYTPVDTGNGNSPLTTGVFAVQLKLLAEFVISNLTAYVVTGDGIGGDAFTAGLYSADGNTKLIDAGANAFVLTGSQRIRQVTLGSPVTLASGLYWFAWASSVGTVGGSVLCHQVQTWFQQLFNGLDLVNPPLTPTRYGSAANALVSNALPATLGTITPFDHTNATAIPAVLFGV